jgi:hypothetical protein
MTERRLPLWLKVGWTIWVALWLPVYWDYYGPSTFLWFCDFANFVILAALWRESSLLLSWQAVSVLIAQIAYTVDVLGRAVLGRHLIGGTEFVFQHDIPWRVRLASLFMHLAAPPLLLWGIRKLGYDRRAFYCQIAAACVILPVCWLGWDATLNLNWVWRPFNKPQTAMAPGLYLLVCIVGYTVLLYLPTHLVLKRIFGRRKPVSSP